MGDINGDINAVGNMGPGVDINGSHALGHSDGSSTSEVLVNGLYNTGSFIGSTLKQRIPLILIAALTLVAVLSWNESANALINQYIPPEYSKSTNVKYKLLYSFLLTVTIVIIIGLLTKYFPQ
jgi:hypothetical protein